MQANFLNIRKSLNKAFLKVKPSRSQIELFKTNLQNLYNQISEKESEEHHKNIVAEFLKNTYYQPDHYINTKGRTDLVIHNGKDAKSSVGVIIEMKRPGNKAEMPSKDKLNAKAVHELVLYYLRERISQKNLEIKYLIATDLYEWFVFNAQDFEKIFAKNKKLVQDFEKFQEGKLSGTKTDFFYNDIVKPFIENLDASIPVTFFDIRDHQAIIKGERKEDDNKLIGIYKIFSAEHLLKLSFSNDSNSLDKKFYNELLHIIGLEERKEGSKKLIGRKAEGKRDNGSLIENAINILRYEDCLNQLAKPADYGSDKEEQLFHVALELSITWINRILFIKLLEGQLIKYHQGDGSFKFLNPEKIPDYDTLNKLFFHVLAIKENERGSHVKDKFKNIPYLNSSLFEPNELEHKTIRISNLENDFTIPILSSTVLKDTAGKKQSGKLSPLTYLLDFLDAYDFSSEGAEDISEENKTLINASVLGLIFEKINGYKDGSFFTPGFITMYMARETIRRSVVQKFNEAKEWDCENLDDLCNKIEDKKEANEIINSLKIVDPAVGSGHFLVSALNEIIAIKSELKVLSDKKGKILLNYHIEVINDEMVITDINGDFFEYHPKNPESQRIQETLFHEKQIIIENCLFGVDINQNSVKICRLRLWIELLKNTYYKPESGHTELETLPNIDINIKCGNSLISRYPLDADIKKALSKSRWTIDSYRMAVMTYRNAENKEQKASMRKLIDEIKSDFESEVSKSDKRFLRLNKLKGELDALTGQQSLFALSGKEKTEWSKKVNKISDELGKLETEIEEIKSNKIYEHAFEWRFEFPEVLNDDGDFVGFDVVIGNPPYIRQEAFVFFKSFLQTNYIVYNSHADLLTYFIELSYNILRAKGTFQFIISSKFLRTSYGQELRKFISDKTQLTHFIDFGGIPVFDEATVDASIIGFIKNSRNANAKFTLREIKKEDNISTDFKDYIAQNAILYPNKFLNTKAWSFENPEYLSIVKKIELKGKPLKEWGININRGVLTGYNEAFIIDEVLKDQLIEDDSNSAEIIKPLLRGRDIQKYKADKNTKWLIGTFPSLKLKIEEFPSIKTYLQTFGKRLEQSGEIGSRKKTAHNWFETQDNIAFWADFKKPKLVWKRIGSVLRFSYDETGVYCLDSTCIATGEKVKFLSAVLNSKLCRTELFRIAPKTGTGDLIISVQAIEPLHVPIPSKEQETQILNIFEQILALKESNLIADTESFEKEIDKFVYELYGLTEEEIKIVEEGVL
ncbi:MAG: Eco57I restriction-modification methylase domain-containing protein [Bacteroidales bacterium]|nr:Eco57I restriction-modification methylase domain-containing protein [Bacteroidales bacterium]MCF8391128.1 Eco57I restriction-modification methylase domain-containing protein [Bacteroidales bacterium]